MILVEKKKRKIKVPEYLVREILNGKKLYYKGYKDILTKKKTPEEIMGSSSIQSYFVNIIAFLLTSKINRKKYIVATNEPGLHADYKNNLSNDIAIFEKSKVTLSDKYFDIPPILSIEVDVKIALDENFDNEIEYVFEKTQKLHEFGVEKVIWFFTKAKKIFIMPKNENWLTINWNQNFDVFEGIELNINQLLAEDGFGEI